MGRSFRLRVLLWIAAAASSAPAIQDAPSPSGRLDALVERAFEEGKHPSLSVGIVASGRLAYARAIGVADREAGRAATPDTLYQVGSITKVFTTTLLAILRDEGVVRLDDPISKWLPEGVSLPTDPRGERAITLRHLATHTSGLPRIPANLEGRPGDPYNRYSVERLLAALRGMTLRAPIGADYSYSNLGMGLLGHLLERAAGKPYETLLREKILDPLGMEDTGITLTEDQRARYAQGYLHDDPEKEAVLWDLGCLAPCGALVSSVPDLARFVLLQFGAGQGGIRPVSGGTLAEMHRPQRVFDAWNGGIGLGWLIQRTDEVGDVVWHNGGMSGHRAHLRFSLDHGVGVIVFSNRGSGSGRNEVDAFARELLVEAVEAFGAVSEEVRGIAEAVGAHIREAPGESLAGLFHRNFLEKIPIEQIEPVFLGLYGKGGACEGIESIRPTKRENGARVVYRMERGDPVVCELQIQRSDPPKILYLRFGE